MHAGTMLKRVSNKTDFEQINVEQFAPGFALTDAARAEAEAEAVDMFPGQQYCCTAIGPVDPGDDP